MKVIPLAHNHILLELANGETLDVNDGTSLLYNGTVLVSLRHPTTHYLKCEQEVDNIRITLPKLSP